MFFKLVDHLVSRLLRFWRDSPVDVRSADCVRSKFRPLWYTNAKSPFYFVEMLQTALRIIELLFVTPEDGIRSSKLNSTDFVDIFTMSASKFIFTIFFGVTTFFGQPKRSALSVFVRLCLKSATYVSTICLDESEFV